jgi:hypothetical protein
VVEQEIEEQVDSRTISTAELNQRLDAVGWGLFFLWVGIALLLDVGWGVGLLGVGIITLGEQAARRYFRIGLDGFWVVVGVLFLAGGMWELAQIQISMVPFLMILVGLAVLASAVKKRSK